MTDPEEEKLKIHIEPDSFKISGKVPFGKREVYILLAILAAALGVSYEEIFNYMGVWNNMVKEKSGSKLFNKYFKIEIDKLYGKGNFDKFYKNKGRWKIW